MAIGIDVSSSEVVSVRAPKATVAVWKAAAEAANLSTSDWIKRALDEQAQFESQLARLDR